MKKYEIAYHYCAEAKRASSAKIIYSNPASDIVRSVKTTAYDQKIYIYVCYSPAKVCPYWEKLCPRSWIHKTE